MNQKKKLAHEKNLSRRSIPHGEGQYIFENNTKGDLILPKATPSGRKVVGKSEQFLGDNYYFSMVRTGDLKMIREVVPPQLIVEQPPTVTSEGVVELKVEEKNFAEEVLLTEPPQDGIMIIK